MLNSIGIHIKVRDFKTSCKFYRNLGFKKTFEYGPDKKVKEDYSGAVFDLGGTKLELSDGHRAVKREVFKERVKSSKISLMIQVSSISGLINSLEKKSVEIAVPARHYYWGTIEVVIRDPDGVVLVFIAPYTLKEAQKVKADETFSAFPKSS